jgi:hypothetical protein
MKEIFDINDKNKFIGDFVTNVNEFCDKFNSLEKLAIINLI